jgi:hypothetical protein
VGDEVYIYEKEKKMPTKLLVTKPERRVQFGRPRHRWKGNVKIAGPLGPGEKNDCL